MVLFTAATLKSLIPALLNLAGGIAPFFGSKKSNGPSGPTNGPSLASVQSQILELQTAMTAQGQVFQNLSKEIEKSFIAIATTLDLQEKRLRQHRVISFITIGIAFVAIVLSVVLKK